MKKMVLLPYDRYQRLVVKNEPPKPDQEPSHGEETQERVIESIPEVTNTKETVILQFPQSMQNRVRRLLAYIEPHVTWNDRGEVTLQDREIPGSNIVDLIKVHLKDYKVFDPVGKTTFGQLLLELNVPRSLLAQSARHKPDREHLPSPLASPQDGKGDLPPPPGIPLKRPVKATHPRTVKWRRL